jgi:hypothetical protein
MTSTRATESTGVGATVAIGSDTETENLLATETGDANVVGSAAVTPGLARPLRPQPALIERIISG